MVDRFDPPRDLDWKPLPMRPDIAGQYVRYSDLAAARDEIERLTKERQAFEGMTKDNYDRLQKAETERDEARAQVAAAYEAAAIRSENYACGAPYNQRASINALANSLRGMTPDDAKAALEAHGREKVREGMQRAADIALCHSDDRPRRYSMDWNDGYIDGCKGASDAILADMEKSQT